jgi:hypothetical protein
MLAPYFACYNFPKSSARYAPRRQGMPESWIVFRRFAKTSRSGVKTFSSPSVFFGRIGVGYE